MMRNAFGDSFFYILYFQEPGVADADLGADPARTMRRLLAGVSTPEDAAPDPAVFANDGRGLRRPPARARRPARLAVARRSSTTTSPSSPAPASPAASTGTATWTATGRSPNASPAPRSTCRRCSSAAALDPVLRMTPPETPRRRSSTIAGPFVVDGAGHWVQQEKPEEVNAALVLVPPRARPRRELTMRAAVLRAGEIVVRRRRARPAARVRPGAGAGQGVRHLRLRPALRQARRRRCSPSARRWRACPTSAGPRPRPRPRRLHGPRVLGRGARGRSRHHRAARRARSSRRSRSMLTMTGVQAISSTATTFRRATASGCCCRRRCSSRCRTGWTSATPRSPNRWPSVCTR